MAIVAACSGGVIAGKEDPKGFHHPSGLVSDTGRRILTMGQYLLRH